MSLTTRFLMALGVILAVAAGMLAAILVISSRQAEDALVVNLAGRQRMLSQRLAMEALHRAGLAAQRLPLDEMDRRMAGDVVVFERTLDALAGSGRAPLTLDPEGTAAGLPKPHPEVAEQLDDVRGLWRALKLQVEETARTGEARVRLVALADETLVSMNKAVVLMQRDAEEHVWWLAGIQTAGVALIVLILAFTWAMLRRDFTRPLGALRGWVRVLLQGQARECPQGRFICELAELRAGIETLAAGRAAPLFTSDD